jgi:hypothetical protein
LTAPQNPKYGPPYQPPADTGQQDPDKGKDLWSSVPTVDVPAPWNSSPPSFNSDPPGPPPGSGGSDDIPECWAISMSMASMRSGISAIISEIQGAVATYNDVKGAVYANKDNVFGQNATYTYDTPSAASVVSGAPAPNPHQEPSPLQNSAKDFAASINPAQEKALEAVANALELCGEFVAAVDRAGQTYGWADRNSKFPPPPSGGVKA